MSDSGVKSIMPKEAWQLIQEDPTAVFIDCRSEMEYLFIGHPKGSIHISWIEGPDWVQNPNFVAEVRKVLLGGATVTQTAEVESHSPPVLLICRSGKRSLEAGKLLVKEGFKNIYNVVEGFEGDLDNEHHRSTLGGWRFHGLPWEQC